MKKMFQKIKLFQMKSILDENGYKINTKEEYYVLFSDGKYKWVYGGDLQNLIRNDMSRKITYIFDLADRISLHREMIVEDKENK